MKDTKKKKKRSKKPNEDKKGGGAGGGGGGGIESKEEDAKRRVLEALVEPFSLSSIDEAALAYAGAGGDPDKAAEILRKDNLIDKDSDDPSACYSSAASAVSGLDLASTSGSSSSDGFVEANCDCLKEGRHKKKVVAATGTVSTVLGKEYVRRNPTRSRPHGCGGGGGSNGWVVEKDEAEQFLFSMLGIDCDLSMAVVRDVLCQCGYNIEKALDALLDLSGSTNDRHPDYRADNIHDMRFLVDNDDNLIDRRSECTSLSSEGEFSDNLWSLGSLGRNYAEVLSSSKANSPISPGSTKSDLPQKVLESLFNIPKNSEKDKDTMNWRNVVKKMQSLGPEFDVCPHDAESQQRTYAKGDEYYAFREDAKQHWDSVKSYYQKAATAYKKGNRAYAAYLSDQGKEETKLAQKADKKASHDIFIARNKGIENVITIDLHGQHVKPALKMLKFHLLFGSYVPSVRMLRVITGCGSHGVGQSKLKQSVISLLKKEAIEWSEENRGTVLIKLNGWREFSFLDSDSDGDSN